MFTQHAVLLGLLVAFVPQAESYWGCCNRRLTDEIDASCNPCTNTSQDFHNCYMDGSVIDTSVTEISCTMRQTAKRPWGAGMELSSDLGNLVNLKKLQVTGFVIGAIPESLYDLPSLTELTIYRNREWQEPNPMSERLSQITTLTSINFGENRFIPHGQIPASLVNLERLTSLNLADTPNICLPQSASELRSILINADTPDCSEESTPNPTLSPTTSPSKAPTHGGNPPAPPSSKAPTSAPSRSPSHSPTAPIAPTTASPTSAPSRSPSHSPTAPTTALPTMAPTPEVMNANGVNLYCHGEKIAIPAPSAEFWIATVLGAAGVLIALIALIYTVTAGRTTKSQGSVAYMAAIFFGGLASTNVSIWLRSYELYYPSPAVCASEAWLFFAGSSVATACFLALVLQSSHALRIVFQSFVVTIAALVSVGLLLGWTIDAAPKPDACLNYVCSSIQQDSFFRSVLGVILILLSIAPLIVSALKSNWKVGPIHRSLGIVSGSALLGLFTVALAFQFTLEAAGADQGSPQHSAIVLAALAILATSLSVYTFVFGQSQTIETKGFHSAEEIPVAQTMFHQNKSLEHNQLNNGPEDDVGHQDSHQDRSLSAWDALVQERMQQEREQAEGVSQRKSISTEAQGEIQNTQLSWQQENQPEDLEEQRGLQSSHGSQGQTKKAVNEGQSRENAQHWAGMGFKIGSDGEWDEYVHRSTGEVFFVNVATNEVKIPDEALESSGNWISHA